MIILANILFLISFYKWMGHLATKAPILLQTAIEENPPWISRDGTVYRMDRDTWGLERWLQIS